MGWDGIRLVSKSKNYPNPNLVFNVEIWDVIGYSKIRLGSMPNHLWVGLLYSEEKTISETIRYNETDVDKLSFFGLFVVRFSSGRLCTISFKIAHFGNLVNR